MKLMLTDCLINLSSNFKIDLIDLLLLIIIDVILKRWNVSPYFLNNHLEYIA